MVLCAGAFGCYAAQGSLPGAQGQGYDLNLSYSRTTLKAVADAITQQVGIAFSYETALAGYPMENLEVSEKGATIEAILAAVFTPRGIDYRVVDKVVVLTRSTRPVPAASAAAKSEVKGVVRDAAGNPMIGYQGDAGRRLDGCRRRLCDPGRRERHAALLVYRLPPP